MRTLILSLFLTACTLMSYADGDTKFEGNLTINYTVTGKSSKTSKLLMTVKENKIALDPSIDPNMKTAPKVILNTTTGEINILADKDGQKVAIKFNADVLQSLGGVSNLVPTYGMDANDNSAKVTATQEFKTISGYKCQKYVLESATNKSEMWVATGIGFDLSKLLAGTNEQMNGLLGSGMVLEAAGKDLKSGETYTMKVDVEKKDISAVDVRPSGDYMVMDITQMIETMLKQNNPDAVKSMLKQAIPGM